MGMGALCKRQMVTYLPMFFSLRVERETGHRLPCSNCKCSDERFQCVVGNAYCKFLPTGGTAKEATFLMAIKLLIALGSLFTCTNGEWVTAPSWASIGTYNALL